MGNEIFGMNEALVQFKLLKKLNRFRTIFLASYDPQD